MMGKKRDEVGGMKSNPRMEGEDLKKNYLIPCNCSVFYFVQIKDWSWMRCGRLLLCSPNILADFSVAFTTKVATRSEFSAWKCEESGGMRLDLHNSLDFY